MRFIIFLVMILVSNIALSVQEKWNTSDSLNRRTCPSVNCGVVGKLLYREKVAVFETSNGWARITKYYDAACASGRSQYVDTGNSDCSAQNGIVGGKMAEWISEKYLSNTQPEDPAKNARGDELLVKGSDDYKMYKKVFVKSARALIDSGKCTESDFVEVGGWSRSSSYPGRNVYFTYCGGFHVSKRIYLDISTGKTFR